MKFFLADPELVTITPVDPDQLDTFVVPAGCALKSSLMDAEEFVSRQVLDRFQKATQDFAKLSALGSFQVYSSLYTATAIDAFSARESEDPAVDQELIDELDAALPGE